MAMDAKLKTRWVKALRSGRYKQCKSILQNDKGQNCCLGVLCRVGSLKRSSGAFMFKRRLYRTTLVNYCDQEELLKHFGLTKNQQGNLVQKNDSGNKTFKEIADWIEKNIKVKKTKAA